MSQSMQYKNEQQVIDWPEQHSTNSFIKQCIIIILGTVVLTVASQISIPLQPIPLTFQSATVVLIGMTCGPRLGAHIVITYLVAGALGLPVFADYHAGISELISPRGGYLIGFLPSVSLSGYLACRGLAKSMMTTFFSAAFSISVIFLFGLTWLASFVGWHQAILLGLTPFVATECIKIFTLACVVPSIWK